MGKRGKREKPSVCINTLNLANNMDFIRYWMNKVDFVSWSTLHDSDNHLLDKSFFSNGWFTPAKCVFPFSYLAVFWDGNITGCCSDGYGTMNLGDAKTQSLQEIWNGECYNRLRKGNSNRLCRSCDFWRVEFVPATESCFNGTGELSYQKYRKQFRRKSH